RRRHAPGILDVSFIFKVAVVPDLWGACRLGRAVRIQIEIGVDRREAAEKERKNLVPFRCGYRIGINTGVTEDIVWALAGIQAVQRATKSDSHEVKIVDLGRGLVLRLERSAKLNQMAAFGPAKVITDRWHWYDSELAL